jgi:hypothetical protein
MSATENKPAIVSTVEPAIIARFHKNLVASGAGVKKNRGIIAAIASDLPAIMSGLDKDAATAARRDMYQHIIAGCVGTTPALVTEAWADQKTWSQDWLSAYGNARSIVSQAMVLSGLSKPKAKPEPRPANGEAKPATETPAPTGTAAIVKDVVATAPADDLALALSKLPPSTFAAILAKAARMSYGNGLNAIDVHFADAIIAASLVREKEAAEPATPCKAA